MYEDTSQVPLRLLTISPISGPRCSTTQQFVPTFVEKVPRYLAIQNVFNGSHHLEGILALIGRASTQYVKLELINSVDKREIIILSRGDVLLV